MNEPNVEVMAPSDIAERFQLQQQTINDALSVLDENLNGQLNTLNLMRIKVPPAGLPTLQVETATGDEMMTEVEGILLASRPARLYFGKAYGAGTKRPPVCVSLDGFQGVGEPGGACRSCPFSAFGSAVRPDGSKGSGQACKQIIQALVLLPGEILPHLLNCPPTSIKAWDHYMLSLVSGRVRFWGCTTKLALEKATSDTGVSYSKLRFRMGTRLEPLLQTILDPYRQRMRDLLVPSVIDTTTYEVLNDDPGAAAPRAAWTRPETEQYSREDEPPF